MAAQTGRFFTFNKIKTTRLHVINQHGISSKLIWKPSHSVKNIMSNANATVFIIIKQWLDSLHRSKLDGVFNDAYKNSDEPKSVSINCFKITRKFIVKELDKPPKAGFPFLIVVYCNKEITVTIFINSIYRIFNSQPHRTCIMQYTT